MNLELISYGFVVDNFSLVNASTFAITDVWLGWVYMLYLVFVQDLDEQM